MPPEIVPPWILCCWVLGLLRHHASGYCASGCLWAPHLWYCASGNHAGYGAWQGAGPCLASTGVFKAIVPQFPLVMGCCCRGCGSLWLPPPAPSQAGSAVSPACKVLVWCAWLWGHGPRAPTMACAMGTCWPCLAIGTQSCACGQDTVPTVVLGVSAHLPAHGTPPKSCHADIRK